MEGAARKRTIRVVGYAIVSALLFVFLSRAAVAWGGDLVPIPLWLATASAVGLGLVGGRETWPAVFVGAGLVGNAVAGFWLFDETPRSLVVPASSVAIELVVAWVLLAPAIDMDRGIRRTRDAMRLVGIFAVIAIIGASIAAIDTNSTGSRIEAWQQWALGEFVGLLVVIPLLVAWRSPWLVDMTRWQRFEAFAQVFAAIGLTAWSFSIDVPILYLVIAVVTWINLRFGARLSCPTVLVVVVLATALSGTGGGPLLSSSVDAVVQIQIFNGAVAACSLVIGAHALRAWDDQHQLAATLRALPDAAAVRTSDGLLMASWVPAELAHLEDALALRPPPNPSTDVVTAAEPGSVAPSRIVSVGNQTFEHRISPIDEGNDLHLFRDISEIHRSRLKAKLAAERFQQSEAVERKRLADALHDGPIQDLTAVQLRLGLEIAQLPPSLLEQRRATERLLRSSIEVLRSASSSLQPPELGDRSLMVELQRVAERFFEGTDLTFEVDDRAVRSLSADESNTLFLVGREAVANIAFHARADHAVIELEEVKGVVALSVRDNGIGLGEGIAGGAMHFGLALMRERMERVGGTLAISGGEGVGTRVLASLAPPT